MEYRAKQSGRPILLGVWWLALALGSIAINATAAQQSSPQESPATDHLPNVIVQNQHDESLHFYDDAVKDKVVVINFVFTRCTMVCPMLGYTFGQLQKKLGERAGEDVFLISVSVDPHNDTPQKLKAWSAQFGTDQGWLQLTGDKANVDTVLKSLQSFSADKVDHTSLILMGNDQTGEWKYVDGTASATTLVAELEPWL